eukprot:4037835-Prymnesium_polylepis.3
MPIEQMENEVSITSTSTSQRGTPNRLDSRAVRLAGALPGEGSAKSASRLAIDEANDTTSREAGGFGGGGGGGVSCVLEGGSWSRRARDSTGGDLGGIGKYNKVGIGHEGCC